ncbi:DUF4142 domain-containing protein [Pseudaminobacter sp. NGMCC 1.201702]|uniref:DUF4142 domain-containing protein n=1 Tax=Pseudaminobacter sp. NGMCC 1.201702 TaxID=3391825 RepID=UPI0039F0970B
MTLTKTVLTSVFAVAIGSIAWAQSATITAQDFATMAASSDLLEIRSSELALQKAQNADVKAFAQMMIKDHEEASKNLMAAAQEDGVTISGEMTEKHAAELEKLNNAGEFDGAYVGAQVAAHEEAVGLMTSFAENGDSAALKAHAAKTAPIIQMHLEHAQKLDAAM